ncbi:unnamed protein product, partial [Allacma fusca]
GLGGISSRFEALDFSSPIAFASVSFYVCNPKIGVKWQAIVFLFDTTVWIVVFSFCIIAIPLFYIHLKLKRSMDTEPNNKIYLAVVIPFATLIQACPRIPHRAGFLTVITLFYALLVRQFYSSNLMSFLTFPEPEVIPQSFEDLSNRKDYTIYTIHLAGGTIEALFNETKIETFTNIRERMIKQKDFLKCLECHFFHENCLYWLAYSNEFDHREKFDAPFCFQSFANHRICLKFPNNIRAPEDFQVF